ncbi:Crp/Fnr family transcriptional regulator [Adhaeribacter radiodurans]|uniref:Crp/Fnr family transcriptional regulator n=1 Tax=Adhaeribacter radiodurans TaxID=2745197 RepID=A0A7L7L1N7_9BACT|nr:Crp/Fnr family transcriptional regulator [Adhaeribacter radiodurans]QMU26694.1 Crp/Fnr family transcriptional regulator [Adhaeribacter radiodurans]
MDFDNLKQHISKRVSFTEEELHEFCQSFKLVKVKKRQFVVQPEFVPRYRFYVVQGSFRAYVIGDEGQEHTIQFAIDDWWITDYNSYLLQQPASMFIMALEDSTLLQIDYETEQALKQRRHVFETYFRILAEATAAHMARRVITNLTKTAEQRYDTFMERYPQIGSKVPQYALASYLGMTTEYLSRLRNKKTIPKKLI